MNERIDHEPQLQFKDTHTKGQPFVASCDTHGVSLYISNADNAFTRGIAMIRMQQHAQIKEPHYFHVKDK